MTSTLIPQFSQKLTDYRSYFLSQTSQFSTNIRLSTQRFTSQDRLDFDTLLQQIRQFAQSKLINFINTRIEKKTESFTQFFDGFEEMSQNLRGYLDGFRGELEEEGKRLKVKEQEGQALLEKITGQYAKMEALKKGFRAFRANAEENIKEKRQEIKMTNLYDTKLKQKCFFPWRALTYKDGYENSVKRQTEVQIRKIHTEFKGILDVLKQKIMETEELIKTKRAAKGQFAYALSKNLLKTISNLSLEVMSLNQVTAKDKESESQTENFLNEVNRAINTRLETVTLYKESLYEGRVVEEKRREDENEEPREIPQKVSPKGKGKRITFA